MRCSKSIGNEGRRPDFLTVLTVVLTVVLSSALVLSTNKDYG